MKFSIRSHRSQSNHDAHLHASEDVKLTSTFCSSIQKKSQVFVTRLACYVCAALDRIIRRVSFAPTINSKCIFPSFMYIVIHGLDQTSVEVTCGSLSFLFSCAHDDPSTTSSTRSLHLSTSLRDPFIFSSAARALAFHLASSCSSAVLFSSSSSIALSSFCRSMS